MDLSALHTTSDLESLPSLAFQIIESRDAQIDAQARAHAAEIQAHRKEIHYKQTRIDALTAEIARLRRVQFAARSEAMNPEQRSLFDDAIAADIAAVESELEALQSPAVRDARHTPRRTPLPPHLPRVETRHEPASCTCGHCGNALTLIGEHVSEKLDCKPLEFFVRRDVHPQYACRACETITAVPVAPAIIDRGIAAPGRLDALHDWLVALRATTLSGSGLAKAIDYSLKRWSALTRYLNDGRYPIDNNWIENAIRPIALGRKNWLFVGSESAGRRAAAIMSLLATAKANGHEPHAWLLDVLTRLPTTLNRNIGQLLPHRWTPTATC